MLSSYCVCWLTKDSDCAQTKFRYHIRVLVPCYKEPLEIVARTVQAAYNAKLPAGCDATMYLCDDGKDPQKRKWCACTPLTSLLHFLNC